MAGVTSVSNLLLDSSFQPNAFAIWWEDMEYPIELQLEAEKSRRVFAEGSLATSLQIIDDLQKKVTLLQEENETLIAECVRLKWETNKQEKEGE